MSEIEDPFRTILAMIEQPTNPHKFSEYPKHEDPIHVVNDWPEYEHDAVLISDRFDESGDVTELIKYNGPMMDRVDMTNPDPQVADRNS